MNKPIRIIQCSHPGSGSTVLSNLLMAYFQPYEKLAWMGKAHYDKNILHNNIVVKTHHKKLEEWNQIFDNKYELFFIISDRNDYDWSEYKDYKNILFIKYNEILETDSNTLSIISNNIFKKCEKLLPNNFMIYNRSNISIQNGINRINNMNKRYSVIKDKPFEFVDEYYQIHGSHRNKDHEQSKKIRVIKNTK